MAKRGRPPEQSDLELAAAALKLQQKHPLLSEGAICGKLGHGREYIADHAKKSELLKATRRHMAAIRQGAWEKKGAEGMMLGKDFNAVAFIWITKNVLGWRDDGARKKGAQGKQSPVLENERLEGLIGQIRAMIPRETKA